MGSLYHLRKRASKKTTLINEAAIIFETVQISTLACWLLLSQLQDRKKIQTIKTPDTHFNVMTIDKYNPLRAFIDSMLEDYEIAIARLYEFVPEQKLSVHIEHLFPGKDLIVIRLNEGDPRLKINSKMVSESPGKGYIFPSNISYEVLEGQTVRYSLVLWGNKKTI